MTAYLFPPFGLFATVGMLTLCLICLFLIGMVVHDVFTTGDLGGGGKALWMLTVVVVPLLGAVFYLAVRGGSMQHRDREAQARRAPPSVPDVAPTSVAPMEGGR